MPRDAISEFIYLEHMTLLETCQYLSRLLDYEEDPIDFNISGGPRKIIDSVVMKNRKGINYLPNKFCDLVITTRE